MKRLKSIRRELRDIAEAESTKLYRIARRAQDKGCSSKLVADIREEATWLRETGKSYPERLLEWKFEFNFKYAFKM